MQTTTTRYSCDSLGRWARYATAVLLVAVGHPARAQEHDTANVRRLGAVGDGVADDTIAIQRAVDSGRGEIRFTNGQFRITKTISVDLDRVGPTSFVGSGPARIVMEGEGAAIRFVGTHKGTAGPSTFESRVWEKQRTPSVTGLEIVGKHPKASGIEATGTMQLTVTRTVIRQAFHGIHLVTRNRNVLISDCHIYENRGIGIFYDQVNLHQSNIIGCHVSYNDGGGIVVRGGDVRNILIGTCDIEGNMGKSGSPPTANILFDSTGGSIGEAAIVGCTIQHTHEAPNSANIRINGQSTARPFTEETRHGNITIADNVLSDVQVNVDVANTRGVTITGNTMWKGYLHNLAIGNSDNIVVANNVFDRNPRYHYGDGSESKNGIVFTNCSGCTVSANQIVGVQQSPAAVIARDCQRFNIIGNSILDCEPCALLLENVSGSRVSDCLIDSSHFQSPGGQPSLKVVGGSGNMIVNNLLNDPPAPR